MEGRSSGMQDASEARDRRNATRVFIPPLELPECWAAVRDISEGGISLLVDRALELGECCDLVLTDAFFHTTEEIRAEVIWTCDNAVGLKWVDLTEKQAQWLHNGFKRWRMRSMPVRVLGGASAMVPATA
jgi:hypothetical protein